jgi:hypothetical protein
MTSGSPELSLGSQVKALGSTRLSGVLIGIGLGAALMAAALILGIDWSENSWTALLCTAGIFIVAGSALSLPRGLRTRRTRLTVYEQGFTFSDGKSQAALRWQDIAAVWKQYAHGTRGRVRLAQITVQGRDGARLALDPNNLAKGHLLAEYLQQRALDHLLPAYWTAYSSGQTVPFGPLQVSQAGLTVEDKSLLWEQVKTVSARGWYVAINESGLRSWASVEISQVPNPVVLLALIDRIGGVQVTLPPPVTL